MPDQGFLPPLNKTIGTPQSIKKLTEVDSHVSLHAVKTDFSPAKESRQSKV